MCYCTTQTNNSIILKFRVIAADWLKDKIEKILNGIAFSIQVKQWAGNLKFGMNFFDILYDW